MPSPRRIALSRAVFVAVAAGASFAAAAPAPIVLPPDTSALKPSSLPGYAIAQQKCGICHSADYVDYQPPGMTLAQWTAEMKKMKGLYGAPLDDREIGPLAAYLTVVYGDGVVPPATESTAAASAPAAQAAGAPAAVDVSKLLADGGCLACHANDKAVFGPAYRDVAARYRGDANALATVGAHIRDGGQGRWGSSAMPANPTLTPEQTTALASYVLKQ